MARGQMLEKKAKELRQHIVNAAYPITAKTHKELISIASEYSKKKTYTTCIYYDPRLDAVYASKRPEFWTELGNPERIKNSVIIWFLDVPQKMTEMNGNDIDLMIDNLRLCRKTAKAVKNAEWRIKNAWVTAKAVKNAERRIKNAWVKTVLAKLDQDLQQHERGIK